MILKKKRYWKRPKKVAALDGSRIRDRCQIIGYPTWSERKNEQN